ncbi:MAG: NADH-quinone oxidoreductase subunit J [Verrucomicrobia bacterium]|nr:NADH-quinone oxidoreductase subunit J [Verrucomicrobiota bacterium]
MRPIFLFLAILTVAGAVAALTARQLVHGALYLAGAFAGLALLYLGLGAQFVGLVQILVYVGAVAILIVFAILLTRSSESPQAQRWGRAPWVGLGIGGLVFGALAVAILNSAVTQSPPWPAHSVTMDATVAQVGRSLMTDHVVALEAIGLLLTAALIGGALIALDEGRRFGGAPELGENSPDGTVTRGMPEPSHPGALPRSEGDRGGGAHAGGHGEARGGGA